MSNDKVKLDYEPFPKQELFHRSDADETLYGGARGGGKSMALLMEVWIRSVENDGHKALILRRTYKQLKKSILRHLREHFPKNFGRFVKTDMEYHFPNGSVIDFGYLDTEDDKYQYQGTEYDFVGFEEVTHFTESQYLYLFSNIRTPKEDTIPVIRCTGNPGNVGHNWVKSRFIDPANSKHKKWEIDMSKELEELNRVVPSNSFDEKDLTFTREYIPATVFDNEYIMKNDPMYVLRLQQLPEDERQAHLYGNWEVFGGQVFKEFDSDFHVIEPFDIPTHWRKFMAIDWGYRDPFCVHWGAVAQEDYQVKGTFIPKDAVVIYREYYGCPKGKVNQGIEREADLVARDISSMEEEPVHIRIGGHDMFAKRGHSGPTIAEEFGNEYIYLQRADIDRLQGKSQVHQRLRIREDEEKPKHAYLYFFNTCDGIIRTLPNLPYDSRKVEDVDTNAEDHP